jgi:hypothetical protein
MQTLGAERIAERTHNMFLADQLLELPWTPLAGKHLSHDW